MLHIVDTNSDLSLDLDDEMPVHRLVPANGQPFPDTTGYTSIFDLASMSQYCGPLKLFGTRSLPLEDKPLAIQDQTHTKVTRDVCVTRCKRLHHTETQAWHEQEIARRARQIVPRPPKQRFTMGKRAKIARGA